MSHGSEKGGYGKPPTEHQFKPGQSGNPKGRPKRPKNNAEILAAISRERIRMVINGKPKWVTPFEAATRRTLQACLAKGNPRDLKYLFDLLKDEGFDWRLEAAEDAKAAGDMVTEKLINLFKKSQPDDEVEEMIRVNEDLECRTLESCPTCGPRIAAIEAEHQADPRLTTFPTRLGHQMRSYHERSARGMAGG